MYKTMSLALALAFGLAWHMPSAGAVNLGSNLGSLSQSDIVSIAQKQRRGKGKRQQQINLSQEHKQKIRETVPAEYHQYLPKSITGGTPAAGAAGAR